MSSFLLSCLFIMCLLIVYSLFFSSFIAGLLLLLYLFILLFLLGMKKALDYEEKQLLILLLSSASLVVLIKTLALNDIFLVNYRINNTLEHINLMLGLSTISYIFCVKHIVGKIETLLITFFGSFSLSVILEILQYFYREHYDLVTGKSHGLYNDSMIDLTVNIMGAGIISYILLLIFKYKNYEPNRK